MTQLPTASGLIRVASEAVNHRAQQICEATDVVWIPVRVQYATAALAAGLRLLSRRPTAWRRTELAALARDLEPRDNAPAQVQTARPLTLTSLKESR